MSLLAIFYMGLGFVSGEMFIELWRRGPLAFPWTDYVWVSVFNLVGLGLIGVMACSAGAPEPEEPPSESDWEDLRRRFRITPTTPALVCIGSYLVGVVAFAYMW